MDPRKGFKDRGAKFCVKILAAVTVVLVLIIILAFNTKGFAIWEETTCHTTACVDESSRIRLYMDTTADPCDDFYQFACGNYRHHHQIPHGEKSLDSLSLLKQKQNLRLRNVLEEVVDGEPEYATQAKTFYHSCMNASRIKELGVKPLHDYVLSKGGWTVLDKELDLSDFVLEDYWAKLSLDARYPGWYNRLFGVGVSTESGSSEYKDNHIITLRQVSLGISKYDLIGEEADAKERLAARVEFITEITHLLGQHQEGYDPEYAKNELTKIVEFEKELAGIHLNFSDLYNETNNEIVTLGDLNTNFTGVDYRGAITKLFGTVGISVEDSDRVDVQGFLYFQNLGDLVQKTDKKTLAGYLMWRFVDQHLFDIDLGPEIVKLEDEMNLKQNKSENDDKPRHKNCIESTKRSFAVPVIKMFIDQYFEGGLERVHDMIDRIKSTMISRIYGLEWLDQKTKDETAELIRATKGRIGFPDFMNDVASVAAEVSKFELEKMVEQNFFENMIEIREKETRKELKSLRTFVNNTEWKAPFFEVNAFYSGHMNIMALPVGILYPPFFDYQGLYALNYGAIGQVLGHEMTHGLDYFTRRDEEEFYNSTLSEASAAALEEKARCVEEVYGNITVDQIQIQINATQTLAENIADVGGMAQAFQAYQSWVREHGQEKSLPGVDLTSNQLFFLGFAQICCSLYTDEALEQTVARKPHTPFKERTLGNMINSQEFAEVYQCKPGARMNPNRKCKIW